MRKIRKVGLFFCLVSATAFLPLETKAEQTTAPSAPAWFPRWEKAKGLVEKGAYLEAKYVYESLLQGKELGARRASIRREYEDLQIKILFSPLATADTLFHPVVSGETLSEIAKRYGTTVELLKKSNGLPSDMIYPGMKLKVTQARFSIKVTKRRNRLTLLADGEPLKTYRVATGEGGSTPAGVFKIVNKLEHPTWFHAGEVLAPHSPQNILGTRWLGFDLPGYGIHGTTLPETLGTHSSRGCIRMHNQDVEEIYALLPRGTEVTVTE